MSSSHYMDCCFHFLVKKCDYINFVDCKFYLLMLNENVITQFSNQLILLSFSEKKSSLEDIRGKLYLKFIGFMFLNLW